MVRKGSWKRRRRRRRARGRGSGGDEEDVGEAVEGEQIDHKGRRRRATAAAA